MRKILLSLLFFCLSMTTFSQSTMFKGFVVEEGGSTKMAGAIVAIDGSHLATTTDENGTFLFDKNIPPGEQIVTVTKEGYKVKYFIINVITGKKVVVDRIQLSLTKKEKKRRKKEAKNARKEEKRLARDREKKLAAAKKEKKRSDKRLAKEKKRLQKLNKGVIITYDSSGNVVGTNGSESVEDVPVISRTVKPENDITPLQIKYGTALGVIPNKITNIPLFEFIDDWMGAPYLIGGSNKEGIDCSSFSQLLYTKVYGSYIERTAYTQYDSNNTSLFLRMEDLQEGDLVFFHGTGETKDDIVHVGVYLGNNKFINSTSRLGRSLRSGVKISDLSELYWRNLFCCGGARVK
jgi:NlpC/P60 family/CarboxypepD_reg-like domain